MTSSIGIVFGAISLVSSTADAAVIYNSNGFEDSGAIFNAATVLAGQDGWLETAGPTTGTVVDSFGKDSAQSVFVERNAGDPGNAHRFAVPLSGPNEQFVSITWDMFVNQTTGLGPSDFGPGFGIEVEVASSIATINRVGGMWLDGADGTMIILTSETTIAFGSTVSRDAWHSYQLLLDLDAKTISGFVDGSPEFTGQAFINATSASDIVTVASIVATATDTGSLSIEGSAFFDNYKVETFPIPEPASAMITFTMGVAVLGTRRNRRKA